MDPITQDQEKPYESKTRDMGIPKELTSPKSIFVRKFRWTLSSPTLSETFVTSVDIDYLNKTLSFSVLEIVVSDGVINTQNFRASVLNDGRSESPMVLRTFDGCGVPIYTHSFHGVDCRSCKQSFDYVNSDCSSVEFMVSYKSSHFESHYHPDDYDSCGYSRKH